MLLDGGIYQNKNAKVNLSVELTLLVIQLLTFKSKRPSSYYSRSLQLYIRV